MTYCVYCGNAHFMPQKLVINPPVSCELIFNLVKRLQATPGMTDNCPAGWELLSGHACAILQQHPLAAAPLHMPCVCLIQCMLPLYVVCFCVFVPVCACACSLCLCLYVVSSQASFSHKVLPHYTPLTNEAELQRSAGPVLNAGPLFFCFVLVFGGRWERRDYLSLKHLSVWRPECD